MAKVNMSSGEVTPTPESEKPVNSVDQVLTRWYGEIDNMRYESSAEYAVEGLSVIYQDTVRIRAMLSRLDTLMSKANQLYRRLQNALAATTALYEDEIDKYKMKPESLIAKGFSYHEREAYYRSNPQLIPYRIKIRELQRQVSDIETFIKVINNKYKNLEGARNDQLLLTSLIRLGYNMREHDTNLQGQNNV